MDRPAGSSYIGRDYSLTVLKVSLAILAVAVFAAAETPEAQPKRLFMEAMKAGGERARSALEMLGVIDNATSETLLAEIFKGKNGFEIETARELRPAQCLAHLSELGSAARDPQIHFKLGILTAIARAGTQEAAEILAVVADGASQPTAGVAFGLLDSMGKVADPALVNTVLHGKVPRSRETALAILHRMKDPRELPAFRAALHDPDGNVRVAGTLGLAQFGYRDGVDEIEAAAADSQSEYRFEALVSLAKFGRQPAFATMRSLIAGPDEAVRSGVVWAIARSESTSLKDFAYRLGLDRQPASLSMLAERLLDPKDPRDRSTLDQMTTNGDEISRLIAAGRLLETPVAERAEFVIASGLASENNKARSLALKYAAGRPKLQRVLARQLGSSDPEVEVAAMSAMVELHQSDRLPEIAPYLASEIRRVSAAAARAMLALDPVASKSFAEQGLNAASSHVRIHSAAMLLAIAAHIQTQ